MRTVSLLRACFVLGLVSIVGVGACGSDDDDKVARCDCAPGQTCTNGSCIGAAGSGGTSGSAGQAGQAGAPSGGASAGATNGGVSGSDNSAGSAGENSAGASGAPSVQCEQGTADCDDNPSDCETNTASDANNCGRCDRVCGSTAACTDGLCAATVILDPPAGVFSNWCGSAFSDTKAYMITCWGTALSEVRAATLEPGADIGGTRIKHYTAATNVSVVALRGILIDGDSVYYGLEANPSNLWKFPLDADGPEDVTAAVTTENGIRFDGLQLVGDTYYWSDNTHTAGGQVASGTIKKRAKTDTESTTLVSGLGLAYNLRVTPTKLVWLEARDTSSNIGVYRAPLAGAAFEELDEIAPATAGSYMIKNGEYVYWTHKAATPDGKLRRLKYADDAATAEDLVTGLNRPEGLIADESYLYFKQLDALYRVPLAGGDVEQLSPPVPANDAQTTEIFHVDDKYVYFGAGPTAGASTVVRVAK